MCIGPSGLEFPRDEMGWLPPSLTASGFAKFVVIQPRAERAAIMAMDTMIGVNLAKSVFQLHAVSMTGEARYRRKLSRPAFRIFLAVDKRQTRTLDIRAKHLQMAWNLKL